MTETRTQNLRTSAPKNIVRKAVKKAKLDTNGPLTDKPKDIKTSKMISETSKTSGKKSKKATGLKINAAKKIRRKPKRKVALRKKAKKTQPKFKGPEREWINGDFEKTTQFPSNDYVKFRDKSIIELFEMMFDDDIVDLILNESTKYAISNSHPDPNITKEEFKVFIGILIISGYDRKPGKRFFWDSENDMGNELIINSMRRDRFITIMRFFHCVDNNEVDTNDKMWKLRPLMDKLQENFLKYFVPTENLNFDESMVKYFGKHYCKQFIRLKPIRFGYKIWCLNTADGYLIMFEVYQGNSRFSNEYYEVKFGKSAAPLVSMLDKLPASMKDLPFQIFIDNLFTGFPLLTYLRERGYGATGTMRVNRIPGDCPLTDKKTFKKLERGHFMSTISKTDGIMMVRWNDNSVVTMASTSYGVEPLGTVNRYSKEHKKIIQVKRPRVVKEYNQYMGGTDRMDEDVSRHRIGIRGKKWYWPLFTWMIDAAINNAWVLYKCSGRPITNLNFRRHIAQTYLRRYGTAPQRPGKKRKNINSATNKRVSDDLRFDRMDHFIMAVPNKKRKRCAGDQCTSTVRSQCMKCGLGLCIGCFKSFHTR